MHVKTHTDIHPPTHALLSLLHMSNPDVLPTYISSLHPFLCENKDNEEAEQGHSVGNRGRKREEGCTSQKGEWKDMEHKKTEGWERETAAICPSSAKGGRKQRGRAG